MEKPGVNDPTRVKHYEIISRLGEGGMGVVYRARDTRLGRTVALKMLSGEFRLDAERSRRFEREAKIVSSVSHPGIATLFDFDVDGESAFLTMELVEGPTLREVLESGALPVEQVLDCGSQVASAIAAAHEHGVIHRDLKPENVMVGGTGFYKVLDFGVARIEDVVNEEEESGLSKTQTPTKWLTRGGVLMGTVAYMSPEQVSGNVADARSDIFALGSLLYELATGCSAFARGSDVATLHAIAYEPPNIPTDSEVRVPRGLALVFEKCLAKDPGKRYSSAAELADDLNLLRRQMHGGSGGVERLSVFPASKRRGLSKRWWLGIAAIVVVGLLGLWIPKFVDRGPEVEAAAQTSSVMPVAMEVAPIPRVIVAFFENQTGDDSASWISSGLPQMLTTDLSRSSQLEVIATQRLHDLLANAGKDATTPLDRSTTAELARWARADIVISGSVFKLGDQYRIDAQAYDVETGTLSAAHKVSGTDLFLMVENLTTGLLSGLTQGETTRPERMPTRSQDAFLAFTEGKTQYENLQFEAAADSFRASIEHDGEFALPQVHLATTLLTMGDVDGGLVAIETALQDSESLPEDERLLAQGIDAYFREGDFVKGAALFADLIERFPRNPESHVWWGRAASELQGDSMEGIRQLRAALKIDRDYLPAVVGLAGEMSRLGAVEESQTMLQAAADRCPMAADAIMELME